MSSMANSAGSEASVVNEAKMVPTPSTSKAYISKKATIVPVANVIPISSPVKVIGKPGGGRSKGSRISHGLSPSNPLHCKCGFKAPLLNFLIRHIEFNKPNRKFRCQICRSVFVTARSLSHHYKTCHLVSQTNELITPRGQIGKLMNCYVKIDCLDLTGNSNGPFHKIKSLTKTEDGGGGDRFPTRQVPGRPILKKKLKKLRYTKAKERFICPWCQRHFPFYRKLARHLALNMHTNFGAVAGSRIGASTNGRQGGAGGRPGALKKKLYECKPCEKIFDDQVEFLRHKAVFHRHFTSLLKFITLQKEINRVDPVAAQA